MKLVRSGCVMLSPPSAWQQLRAALPTWASRGMRSAIHSIWQLICLENWNPSAQNSSLTFLSSRPGKEMRAAIGMLHNYCMLLSWNGFIPGIAHLIHLYLHPGTFQSWVSNVSKIGCPEILYPNTYMFKHTHLRHLITDIEIREENSPHGCLPTIWVTRLATGCPKKKSWETKGWVTRVHRCFHAVSSRHFLAMFFALSLLRPSAIQPGGLHRT